jgi:hypothetical protein
VTGDAIQVQATSVKEIAMRVLYCVHWTLALLGATLVGACGGGGDAPVETAPAAAPSISHHSVTGVFGATMTSAGVQREAVMVVVGDPAASPPTGRLIMGIYGTDAATAFKPTGHFHADTLPLPGVPLSTFSVTAGDRVLSLSMDPAGRTILGTIRLGSEEWAVSGGAVPGGYDPDTPASVTAIQGQWAMTTESGLPFTIDVAADGAVSFAMENCTLSATFRPVTSHKNVFAVSMAIEPACEPIEVDDQWPLRTGFALVYPSTAGNTQLVLLAYDDMSAGGPLVAAGRR